MPLSAATRVSDRIKHDHQELQEYYNNIKQAPRDDDKVKWQNQFVWELARHSIAEELVVYPAFEKHIPDGVRMAEKDRSEHQQVRYPPPPQHPPQHPLQHPPQYPPQHPP
jgi:hemerythrin superfamily protein